MMRGPEVVLFVSVIFELGRVSIEMMRFKMENIPSRMQNAYCSRDIYLQ